MHKYTMRTNLLISYLTLLSGLSISIVAIFYSVTGLVSIFSGAALSIIIMGSVLEISKLIATIWLKRFWNIAPIIIKTYLISAIIILMLITSLGIFGFLARANVEQSVSTGEIEDKLFIIDEKIKIQEDIILSSKNSLSQLDNAVDQLMSRSDSTRGAIRSEKTRQSQKQERISLQNTINVAQTELTKLRDEKTPILIQSRKKSVEYGPIKYISGLLFNDGISNLENAVKYVIILLVIVFDPLAVILLLCSQYSFTHINHIKTPQVKHANFKGARYKKKEFNHSSEQISEDDEIIIEENEVEINEDSLIIDKTVSDETLENEVYSEKKARSQWKANNNNDTIKHQEKLYDLGLIDKLPWDNTNGTQ